MDKFLQDLINLSWRVESPLSNTKIPRSVTSRYGALPSDLISLITSFSLCVDSSDEAWFVSANDLSRDGPFRFNEFELISLSSADSDESLRTTIQAFWQSHFPLFISVRGSYQYFAYSLVGSTRGQIVYGFEPEFEECDVISSSLREFLSTFLAMARSPEPLYPFSHAIPRDAA